MDPVAMIKAGKTASEVLGATTELTKKTKELHNELKVPAVDGMSHEKTDAGYDAMRERAFGESGQKRSESEVALPKKQEEIRISAPDGMPREKADAGYDAMRERAFGEPLQKRTGFEAGMSKEQFLKACEDEIEMSRAMREVYKAQTDEAVAKRSLDLTRKGGVSADALDKKAYYKIMQKNNTTHEYSETNIQAGINGLGEVGISRAKAADYAVTEKAQTTESQNNEVPKAKDSTDIQSEDVEKKKSPRTPENNGHWDGERGDSTWYPDDDYVPPEKSCNPEKPYSNPDNLTLKEIFAKYGIEGIPFKDGYPDFSEVSKGTVEIDGFETGGNLAKEHNFKKAYVALAEQRGCTPEEVEKWMKENNYTWHECEDKKTMQKVPNEVHANVPHDGGRSRVD